MKASQIMQKNVLAVQPGVPIEKLAEFFVTDRISGAPVTDHDNRLIGVVSQADLVSAITNEPTGFGDFHSDAWFDLERLTGHDESLMVHDIMSDPAYTVEVDTPVAEVARLMVDNRIHRVVVTRDGQLAGLISSLDLAALLPDLLKDHATH